MKKGKKNKRKETPPPPRKKNENHLFFFKYSWQLRPPALHPRKTNKDKTSEWSVYYAKQNPNILLFRAIL